MFLAKCTPSRSSPGLTPSSSSRSSGCTEMSRDWPSASASRAAFSTAPFAQPPPIQPAAIVPSRLITALAPAFAAVTETVRTTVASTKGSSAAFSRETRSIRSTFKLMRASLYLEFGQIGFQFCQALERVGGRIEIDMGKCGLDAGCLRRIVRPSHHGVQPDDTAASLLKSSHLAAKQGRIAGLVAIRDDHHAGPRVDGARRMPAVEGAEALADFRSAARARGHERQPVEGA